MSEEEAKPAEEPIERMIGQKLTLASGSTVTVCISKDGSAYLKFVRAADSFETELALSRAAMDAVVYGWTNLTLSKFE